MHIFPGQSNQGGCNSLIQPEELYFILDLIVRSFRIAVILFDWPICFCLFLLTTVFYHGALRLHVPPILTLSYAVWYHYFFLTCLLPNFITHHPHGTINEVKASIFHIIIMVGQLFFSISYAETDLKTLTK